MPGGPPGGRFGETVSITEREHNPFIRSGAGGRTLSALQLPIFALRPPSGYGVLTTTGRKTGKRRRRCVRAIRRDGKVYLVAIRGRRTGWARNVQANPDVRLRMRGGSFDGVARDPQAGAETEEAREAYCETVTPFDYLTCAVWRKGRPTRSKIEELLLTWFDEGTPVVVELEG